MTDLTWVREEENALPEAVRELIREAHSENTRRAYQSDLRAFRKWGGDVPTNPHELAHYIAEEGERLHPSTIQRRLAALSATHRLTGGSGHPTHHPLVKAGRYLPRFGRAMNGGYPNECAFRFQPADNRRVDGSSTRAQAHVAGKHRRNQP